VPNGDPDSTSAVGALKIGQFSRLKTSTPKIEVRAFSYRNAQVQYETGIARSTGRKQRPASADNTSTSAPTLSF